MVKIIAELSINHLGMKNIALAMLEKCKTMGVDYVKFKIKNVNKYYKAGKTFRGYDFKTYRSSMELDEKDFIEIDSWCSENNLKWFSTIHDNYGFDFISRFNPVFYKIASSDAQNQEFISWFINNNTEKKTTIVSTGGLNLKEIESLANNLVSENIPLIVNHCVSIYPTPIEQTNIGMIKTLRDALEPLGVIVGYSGHEEGWIPTLLAVELGAKFIERHLTLTRNWKIHHIGASLTTKEFSDMIKDIRNLETIMRINPKSFELDEFEFLRKRTYK